MFYVHISSIENRNSILRNGLKPKSILNSKQFSLEQRRIINKTYESGKIFTTKIGPKVDAYDIINIRKFIFPLPLIINGFSDNEFEKISNIVKRNVNFDKRYKEVEEHYDPDKEYKLSKDMNDELSKIALLKAKNFDIYLIDNNIAKCNWEEDPHGYNSDEDNTVSYMTSDKIKPEAIELISEGNNNTRLKFKFENILNYDGFKILNENYITEDGIECDYVIRNKIFGRFFETEQAAKNYLNYLHIELGKVGKTINDFNVIKEKGNSLKPWRIYPKPSEKDLKRIEALDYIKKFGYYNNGISINNKFYLLSHENSEKLRELGVKFKFVPLSDIDLSDMLCKFIKDSTGRTNRFKSNVLYFYDMNNMDNEKIKELKNELNSILIEFNKMIGSSYHITDIEVVLSDMSLINKLKEIKGYKKTYKNVYFRLIRDKEDEYLIKVGMDNYDFPEINI